uniref:Huntingtin interacting protein 1 n=1 Tax=Varanus komodoensis TaxID=61221 RepID=A0A8D2J7T8_VARKO
MCSCAPNLQYFKRLIQIPQLPENPPNFLRASALSEHISPVVVIPVEASSPDSEPIMDLVEMEATAQQSLADNRFDDIFGSSFSSDPFNFNSQNGMTKDDKDRLIERLHREISLLKDELKNYKAESHRLTMQLKGRVSELEAELAEQQHLKQQALDESDFLRAEMDELKKRHEDTEKAQRSLTEFERKAQATEQRYTKLKEKYSELVQNHADLLRKNAEVTKQVTLARQVQGDAERDKKELEDSFQQLSEQAQRKTQEQAEVLAALKRELTASKQEVQALQSSIASSAQVRHFCSAFPAAVGSVSTSLCREVAVHGSANLLPARSLLSSRAIRGRAVGTAAPAAGWCHESTAVWAPALCSASKGGALAGASQHSRAPRLPSDVSSLLPCVMLFAHLMGDTILQASATSHMAPLESADLLLEACKRCGSEALAYLGALKDRAASGSADCTAVRNFLRRISAIGEDLRPRGLDIEQEQLGDLVDREMAATAAAIETAAARIEEMLSKSRAGDSGVKLEVNERILGSCTDLMQAIQALVEASKELQQEIVESGRGAASPKEFYARNSRWTEGLISASKAVGWGATVMVDAADLVIQGQGKFEELMVCSHEIAASTAQLVAASKVKADKDSANLSKLQVASRGVNQATARLVASTKSARSQIQETDSMDFSAITLMQIKRQEMDSQVRVLELESQLQKERQRLGELRKKHYELAGVAEGWDEDENGELQSAGPRACVPRGTGVVGQRSHRLAGPGAVRCLSEH